MFKESPFTGTCSFATLEVLVMLFGTLFLGLLLGFLIWGWLRRRVRQLDASVAGLQQELKTQDAAIDDLKKSHLEAVEHLNKTHQKVKDELDSVSAKLTMAEYRLRNTQEELLLWQTKAEEARSELEALKTEVKAAEEAAGIQAGKSQWEEEPTLADISDAMASAPDGADDISREANSSAASSTLAGNDIDTMPLDSESLHVASELFGRRVESNDLTLFSGIDAKVEEILHRAGITTWYVLAGTEMPTLRRILEEAGPVYGVRDPRTWPRQARMAALGEWKKLKSYQELIAGRLM